MVPGCCLLPARKASPDASRLARAAGDADAGGLGIRPGDVQPLAGHEQRFLARLRRARFAQLRLPLDGDGRDGVLLALGREMNLDLAAADVELLARILPRLGLGSRSRSGLRRRLVACDRHGLRPIDNRFELSSHALQLRRDDHHVAAALSLILKRGASSRSSCQPLAPGFAGAAGGGAAAGGFLGVIQAKISSAVIVPIC